MNNAPQCIIRPPLGFVVEGHDEFHTYPSLVHRIVGIPSGFKVPIANAGGCGKIYRSLRNLITNVVQTDHPYSLIITADLRDAVTQGYASNCIELIEKLEQQVNCWRDTDTHTNERLAPLPIRIVIVVQVQSFESWMLADIANLIQEGHVGVTFGEDEIPVELRENTDEAIANPGAWLKQHKTSSKNLKSTKHIKSVVSCLDPSTMRDCSRSFRKFHKEVSLSYQQWCEFYGF